MSSRSAAHLAKRAIVGRPLSSSRVSATLLPKRLALPIFASDALSSVAYATEAALAVLLAASASGGDLLVPISVAIAALLLLVVASYRQTVAAYPGGGGAYVVAGENLGRLPGLVAGASLLVDYVLTVAVSISAGVLAITSAVPSLQGHGVVLSIGFLALLATANLRGVREAGVLFALPTYAFIAAMLAMIVVGLAECAAGGCPQAAVPHPAAMGGGTALSAVVVLRAFASGSSALTGVEAIANGTRAFRPPQARNAAQTLAVLGAIATVLFLGVSILAAATGARPSATASVLSEVARAVFPSGSPAAAGFIVVQASTFAILVLAANTAFQGFPRLTAILARDHFVPHAFANLGDRLVHSNGVVALALVAGALIAAFGADPSSLLHLYLLGVFTAFTLSQVGMLRHWQRSVAPGRRRKMAVNGLGALGTGLVAVLVIATKFIEGAWMVLVAVPLLIGAFLLLHRHYRKARLLLTTRSPAARSAPPLTVILPVEGLDAATAKALAFVHALRGPQVRVVHATDDPDAPLAGRWEELTQTALEVVPAHGSPVLALAGYAARVSEERRGIVDVVIPEQFARRSLRAALRRTAEFRLAARLLDQPGVVVTHVPELVGSRGSMPGAVLELEALVLVPEVDDTVSHAVAFALSLGAARTRALHVALDPDAAKGVRRDWRRWEMPLPLELIDAPYRSLEDPVLDAVRGVTAHPDRIALVVVPEVDAGRWWKDLLHNERSLYVKWLLRFEPRVIVAGVPLPRRL